MKSLIAILAGVLCVLSARAQPLTEADLGWPNNCIGAAYGGYRFYVIQTNTVLTNILGGGGTSPVTFSIFNNPSHGTENLISPATGSNTYTPTLNYAGNDGFDYLVALKQCPRIVAPGSVDITIVTNISTNVDVCATWVWTNHMFAIISGGATNGGVVCDPPTSPCPAGQAFVMHFPLDISASWSLSFHDSLGIYGATTWTHAAGDPVTTWSPSIGIFQGQPFFCVPPLAGGNCVNNYGDVSTWKLCAVICGSGCINNSGTITSSGADPNNIVGTYSLAGFLPVNPLYSILTNGFGRAIRVDNPSHAVLGIYTDATGTTRLYNGQLNNCAGSLPLLDNSGTFHPEFTVGLSVITTNVCH